MLTAIRQRAPVDRQVSCDIETKRRCSDPRSLLERKGGEQVGVLNLQLSTAIQRYFPPKWVRHMQRRINLNKVKNSYSNIQPNQLRPRLL